MSAKPVIFLNAVEGVEGKVKLVLKDFTQALQQQLAELHFIEQHQGSLQMRHDADLIRQLSDYLIDRVWINTRYLSQKPVQVPRQLVSLQQAGKAKALPIVHLLPMQHEGNTFLKLQLAYHKPLYQVLFQMSDVRWSRTYRCFITYFSEESIMHLLKSLKGMARLSLSSKVSLNRLPLQKALWEQQLPAGQKGVSIQLLEFMQLKNYSRNTMRTYYAMILKFLNASSLPLEIIHAYSEAEVNTYHARLKESGRYSVSYINQSGTRSPSMPCSFITNAV